MALIDYLFHKDDHESHLTFWKFHEFIHGAKTEAPKDVNGYCQWVLTDEELN
jgi:hypothetical protein